MQVFKTFFKIILKNKSSILIYVGIFFGLAIMLSSMSAKNDKTQFSQTSLKIAVDNQDQGKLGDGLVDYLSEENEMKKMPKGKEDLLDDMYYEEVEYTLVIPKDFSKRFLTGEREHLLKGTIVPGRSASSLAENEINQFLTTLALYTDSGYEEEKAVEMALETMQEESRVEFQSAEAGTGKAKAAYYFQFLPYIFISVMIMGLGVVLMAFNKKDMDARNKCSAMSFTKRNMQIILGSIVLMLMIYALFMIVPLILYPDYMMGVKGVLSVVNALVFMFVSLALGFLVGRLTKSTNALNMVGNVLGLGFSFLGGVFVPFEMIHEDVKKLSQFIPSYWYTISNETIQKIESFQDAGPVIQNSLIQMGFAVAILAVTMLVNRMKARSV